MTSLFDLGLQLERTALAWRRTALAVAAAAVGGARLLPPTGESWAAGVATGGLAAAAVLSGLAGRRYAAVATALLEPPAEGRIQLPGGGVLAALATLQVLAGLLALMLMLR